MPKRRRGAGAEPEVTVFLHVPKAGGQTVRGVLGRIHGSDGLLDYRGPLADDVTLEADWSRVRLVEGHLVWGAQDQVPGPTAVVTILREPVSRIVSLHRYMQRTTEHPLHDQVRDLDLIAFVESGIAEHEVVDAQVRQISGQLHRAPDQGTLDAALRNVEAMAAVGTVEDLASSLLVFRRRLGWPLPVHRSHNRASRPPRPLEAREQAAVESVTRLDRQLHNAACERLARDVAAAGMALQIDRVALGLGNRVLAAIRR